MNLSDDVRRISIEGPVNRLTLKEDWFKWAIELFGNPFRHWEYSDNHISINSGGFQLWQN